MNDKMDELLARLPTHLPPSDLARRICLAVRGHRQAQPSPFAWAGRRTQRLARLAGLMSLALLGLWLLELVPPAAWPGVFEALLVWAAYLWQAPAEGSLALGQSLLGHWQDLTGLGLTVLPLALALLAMAMFALAACRLVAWTDPKSPMSKGVFS